MGFNRRHLESLPYLILATTLGILFWLQLPVSFFVLLLIPVTLAALLHGLKGGTITATAAAGGLIIRVMLEPLLDERISLWQQIWPVLITYFVVGVLIGWLTEQEKERERTRIHKIDMERTRYLTAIHDAGREIAASLDLERTLRLVMNKAGETLPMDAGVLFTFDDSSQLYRVAVSYNLPPEKMAKITFSFD